jgi:hypothetical protein
MIIRHSSNNRIMSGIASLEHFSKSPASFSRATTGHHLLASLNVAIFVERQKGCSMIIPLEVGECMSMVHELTLILTHSSQSHQEVVHRLCFNGRQASLCYSYGGDPRWLSVVPKFNVLFHCSIIIQPHQMILNSLERQGAPRHCLKSFIDLLLPPNSRICRSPGLSKTPGYRYVAYSIFSLRFQQGKNMFPPNSPSSFASRAVTTNLISIQDPKDKI